MGGEIVQDHVDRCPVRPGLADRLQCGQGVCCALAASHDAPELVVADAVAAVELPHAVQFVIVRREPVGMPCRCPAGAAVRTDREGAELVEREHSLGEMAAHVLDTGEFGVAVRVVGLLPGLGSLKGDAVAVQDLAQPLPPDADRTGSLAGEVVGELAHAPPGERPPQRFGAGFGRRDDERLVVRTDLAGTATRPLRV